MTVLWFEDAVLVEVDIFARFFDIPNCCRIFITIAGFASDFAHLNGFCIKLWREVERDFFHVIHFDL